ncbi:MAG: hydrogenase [Acidobacteriota bacterium]
MNQILVLFLVGVALTTLLGLGASWVDRKVTARVQYRVGPPLLQPVYDLLKLAGKETVLPRGADRVTFLAAPAVGLAAVVTVSVILWAAVLYPEQGILGDWIVVLYLLLVPSLAVIVGGSASGNPLAAVGASREMQLLMAYELPFVLAALVPVIRAGMTFRLGELVLWQAEQGWVLLSWSGVMATVVALVAIQAKLALVPFDLAEAETELAGGALIEYSGTALALVRLTRSLLLFVLPFLLLVFFLGGGGPGWKGVLAGVVGYVVLLLLITVIRNTNPRVRIDQALRFFWGPLTVVALAAVVLALLGY